MKWLKSSKSIIRPSRVCGWCVVCSCNVRVRVSPRFSSYTSMRIRSRQRLGGF